MARYTPMLLSCARRIGLSEADAQDVVAATLVTFLEGYAAGKYDRGRGRLKAWLKGMLINHIRRLHEYRRVRVPQASRSGLEPAYAPAALDEFEAAFDREWELQKLAEAQQALRRSVEPTTYQAFDLYALKGWTAQRVAEFLEISVNQVYVSKSRCVGKLRALMAGYIQDHE